VSEADAETAAKVVLLDSMIINIDRTPKNTNLLNWNKELWLIDHGASLYFHHNWAHWEKHLDRTFPNIKDHVLLARATNLMEAATEIQSLVNTDIIADIIANIPEDWLEEEGSPLSPSAIRAAYEAYLNSRIAKLAALAKEAADAQ
jgi:hypothetical protein